MNAVDTNILLYVHDPRDPNKQSRASDFVRAQDEGVLLWQVACEYLAASRKLSQFGYSFAEAWDDIRDLRRVWTTVLPRWEIIDRANELISRYSLSFWDATIVAACLEAGVTHLHSEDISAYPKLNGLVITNPLKE